MLHLRQYGCQLLNRFIIKKRAYAIHLNEIITLKKNKKMEKQGYAFGGWIDEHVNPVSETPLQPGDQFIMPDRNVTLKALWLAFLSYSINVNGGNENYSGGSPVGDYAAGATLQLPTTNPTRTGYTFLGWAIGIYLQGDDLLQAGDTFELHGDTEVKAMWLSNNAKTVTFDINGGEGSVPSIITAAPGETVGIPTDW